MKNKHVWLATAVIAIGILFAPTTASAQTRAPVCDGQPATIVGTEGNDVIQGTSGVDVIFAAQGDDTIFGLAGDDIICAGQGDDVVVGGFGFDVIFGAQGDDVLFAASGSSLALSADTRGARMFGGEGADVLIGSNRWDRMQGGPGRDVLTGFEGRDWLRGGPDTDYIDGGASIDDLHGGTGDDHIRVTASDTVRGSTGTDLCDILGAPRLLRSCTSSQAAFLSAEFIPAVPPNAAGIEEIYALSTELVNGRESDLFVAITAERCGTTVADFDDTVAGNNRFFSLGWTMSFSVDAIRSIEGRNATVDVRLRFFNRDGQFVHEQTETSVLVYERGVWRSTECLGA